ncbi:helix-turn-helix transcriptional regulator [Tenacibaculum sp. Mcav3-52]|uniref:helix-turn-helix domain-containing protein n=1 Tax=Tenacibaculum sp. Mcav3-52 TaxID=2917762 RepID=UPI001EF25DD3|nr:helix-turn-helix transcriptional regulator [Tenacibaculum sp. Mcav3-52]MCG7501147.1 helix-turn-helix transcriptional regulator [Tenacibaculum sp. Mcav3-52]
MSIDKLINSIKESSIKDTSWIDEARYRRDNKDWLDISFQISVKVLSALSNNKKTNKFPKNQKELADQMKCSPQYVSKLLKGTENLQLETITKIEKILNISLIKVPQHQTIIENNKYTEATNYNSVYYSIHNVNDFFTPEEKTKPNYELAS